MTRAFARVLCFLVAFCLVSVHAPLTRAQTQTTGSITGVVVDAAAGQPIPNATVTVTNEETGIQSKERADGDGNYVARLLPPGDYTISASAPGYESDSYKGFSVYVTKQGFLKVPPFALRRSGAQPTTPPAQPVQSEGGAVLVNTVNATRGGNFDMRQLLSLPLPGIRTFDDLAFLLPGVALPPLAIGSTVGPGIGPGVGTSGQFSVNGLRSRSNNFTIDGSDNNDEEVGVRRQGFTSLVPQSIESVQDYHVTTLLPEPAYGRNMGAQVDAVSRSGGVGYHGTLYGFFTDKDLKARDPFDFTGGPANFPITRSAANGSIKDDRVPVLINGQPLAPANPVDGKNAYTRGQYGFVLGGPIIKKKTHWFASFEHQDINASKESHFAVPTIAQRGLFKSGDVGLTTTQGASVFPTSLGGDSFFSLFPFPNNPSGPYGPNTFTEILPASADGTILSIKLDQNLEAFGKDHTLSGRYNFTDDNTILPVTGEALFSSLRALVRTQDFALSFNSALSSRTANQFRFSFGRTHLAFKEVRDPLLIPSKQFPNTPFLLNRQLVENITLPGGPPQLRARSGLDTENAFDVDSGTGPLGQLAVSGFSPVGVDVFNFPQGRANNLFQYADTLIYNLRKHRLTMGADIRRSQLNSFQDRNVRPLAVFSAAKDLSTNLLTGVLKDLGSVFVPAANLGFYLGKDFLAVGAPTGFFQTLARFPDSAIGLRYWQNDFFFSDQIRVSPNFTLTLGLRYELNTVPKEVHRRIESTFNSPEVQQFEDIERQVVGASGLETFLAGRRKIYPSDYNNVAPHIAFAWDPFGHGKTSIRAGYGIYYDQILGAVISQSRNVFPSFLTIDLAGGLTNPLTDHALSSFNPARLAAQGTLNTYNAAANSNIVNFLVEKELATTFVTAPGFVLPAADLVTPYSQHWGLTIEQEIKRDLLFSIAYVGTRGAHLLRSATPNQGPNAIPVVDQIVGDKSGIPGFLGFVVPPSPNFKLRPFPLLGSFTSIESDANSIYHALQLQAIKRFSHGLQFTTSYTWSHAIDEVSDIFDLAGTRALPQNSFDRRAERGDANFDVRHRFVYSAIWDLPIFEQSKILGGWQLASIGTFQTGQPYSVLFCCDLNLDGNLTERVSPGVTNPGSTGRNVYRAPGIATVDLAVNKHFRFSERHRLEIRSEFFNLFNRANFGIPIHQLFFGSLSGEPASKDNKLFVDTRVPMRTIQFALKFSF